MPTVGWILEAAVERYWESVPRLPPTDIPRPMFKCTQCGKEFSSAEELRCHFSLEHPLELPALYVCGSPLLRESVIRSPIAEDDVEFFQCSRCDVQIDGAFWQSLTVSELRKQFCQSRNSIWNVRLVHERSMDDSRALKEYSVRFRIPDTAILNAIDKQFIQTLALEYLTHNDLEQFETILPADAPGREYGGALGDYGMGIILKEHRSRPHAPVDFAEFAIKMRSALDTLRHFHRPVALAVSSSICLNLNDFHDYGIATETDLDYTLKFFRSAASTTSATEFTKPAPSMPRSIPARAICPVDQISHQMLLACNCLFNGASLTLSHLDDLRHIIDRPTPVSMQDIAKIHVICAEGYLRLGRVDEARIYLRKIQFDALFKGWAQHHLEDISTHDH